MTQGHPAADALRWAGFAPEDKDAPCAECGKTYREHGSYPTCASHPYTTPAAKQAADSLARLRVIRLWHWRQLLRSRMHARSCASPSLMRQYNDEADMHLGFVQSLNDFFSDPQDTAERDASK